MFIELLSSGLEDINTKNHPKRKDDKMITIIKQELDIDESLKTKLSYICEFANTTPTFIKGNIRKLDKTNLTYIEPHRIIIKGINFLFFNYSNEIYIENLSTKIKISELQNYIKSI